MNLIEDGELHGSPAMQNALSILAKTSQAVGEAFFPLLVEGLSKALDARWVFVCMFDRGAPDRARTLANWDNGPAENFVYSLRDTPCATVVTKGVCCFPDDIQARFPLDTMLVDMGAQSYAGTRLRGADGRALGLIVVLDEQPFPDPAATEAIVELFSGRAAAEIERLTTATLNERLGRMVEASVSEAYVFDAETFLFELVNRGARENLGYAMDELRCLTPWDLKPEYSKEQFIAYVQPLIKGEISVLRFETVHLRKDGTTYPVAVQLQFYPDAGSVFFASITDETERKAQEEREHLILREMNHRAKNVLAVVQVLARQTARRTPEDYLERLDARIGALAASHDVLVSNSWKDLPFEDLVRSQLGHFKHLIGSRILLSGDTTRIKATAAQALGLALHELSTNAAKYGALSNDAGQVEITWRQEQGENGPVFALAWRESGGPEVTAPQTRGFGSVVIENSLQSQFDCTVDIEYAPAGLNCVFSAPAARVLAEA